MDVASSRTPPPKSSLLELVPQVWVTPRCDGDLNQSHETVLSDLKKSLIVPYDIMVRSIFGDVILDIERVRQGLMGDNVLTHSGDNSPPRWTGFPDPPAQEDITFAPLADILSGIFSQVAPCNLTYRAASSKTSLSTSRPDAHISYIRERSSSKTHWWDIAIPFEFKKKNTETMKIDNERKIIWSLHNMMREDPRRRFALGITIEGNDLRIWYHNHQEIDELVTDAYLAFSATLIAIGQILFHRY